MHEAIDQYLHTEKDFPYCVGCGHTMINRAVANAMAKSGLKATEINLVSDIGCVGLVDKMFRTNTIHTTHGRSTAFATGVQLADEVLFNGKALNVVMIGDGGATIGLLHLVEAAKMNANITVVLHNNFVYGMTGGQNSGLTPENFRTATTMSGNIVPNIHIAKLLEAAHAGFIARKLATDRDLDDTLVEAYNYDGFALVEIVELCTGYATKWNPLSKKDIEVILENSDQEERGIIVKKDSKAFAKKYQEAFKAKDDYKKPKIIEVKKDTTKEIKLNLILAGTAGEGVQFASSTLAKSLVKQSLRISQKNDNPVTIGTGYSVSELKVSNEEIYYSAIDKADYILISTEDGFNRIYNEIHKGTKIIIDSSVYTDENKKKLDKLAVKVYNFDYRSSLKDKRLTNFKLIDELYNLESDLDKDLLLETMNETGKASDEMLASISV